MVDTVVAQPLLWRAVAIVGGLLLAVFALTWVARSVRPEPRPDVVLNGGADTTIRVSSAAAGEAVASQAETLPGVARARARLVGSAAAPALRVTLWLADDADVRCVLARSADEVLATARASLDLPALPVAVRLELERPQPTPRVAYGRVDGANRTARRCLRRSTRAHGRRTGLLHRWARGATTGSRRVLLAVGLLAGCTVGPSTRPPVAVRADLPAAPPAPPGAPVPLPAPEAGARQPPPERLHAEPARRPGRADPDRPGAARRLRHAHRAARPGPARARHGDARGGARRSWRTCRAAPRSPRGPPLLVVGDSATDPTARRAVRMAAQVPTYLLAKFAIIGLDRRGAGTDTLDCADPSARSALVGRRPGHGGHHPPAGAGPCGGAGLQRRVGRPARRLLQRGRGRRHRGGAPGPRRRAALGAGHRRRRRGARRLGARPPPRGRAGSSWTGRPTRVSTSPRARKPGRRRPRPRSTRSPSAARRAARARSVRTRVPR